jgi:hypothetical protein
MIKYLKQDRIDRKRYEACLDACAYDALFARPWFLDAVCPQWDALVQGDYEAVFPLAVKRKLGIRYAYQPFFTRYFGVYGGDQAAPAASFLEAVPGEIMYLNMGIHESNRLEPGRGYVTRQRKYQALDLSPDYEALKKSFGENARRNIRKAEKQGLAIRPEVPFETVIDLFRKGKGRELKEYKQQDYNRLSNLMEACLGRGQGHTIGVTDSGGSLVAAAFLMGGGSRFTFLKSGVTPTGRTVGAMHALFDYFIRKHAGTPAVLDFGGSSVDSVARFDRGFGASEIVYLQFIMNRLKQPFRMFGK